jgi:hypothetical protein
MKATRYGMSLAGALALALSPCAVLTGAEYRMQVSFPGYTNRAEALVNFPVLVVLSNNVQASGFDYGTFLSTNGWDLRFGATEGATDLDYEIEKWNTNGASYVWVRVPSLPGDGDGEVWASWGLTDAQLPCTTNGTVWTNGYVGVWHFGNGSGATAYDSTLNNPGTLTNTMTQAWTNGTVGGALYFNGTNSGVSLGTISSGNPLMLNGSPLTISVWMNESDSADNAYPRIVDKSTAGSAANGYALIAPDENAGQVSFYSSGSKLLSVSSAYSYQTWTYLTCVKTASGGAVYVNAAAKSGTSSAGTPPDASAQMFIGNWPNAGSRRYKGIMDELRISSVARSSNWVWACWMNQASNWTFNAFGEAAAQVAGAPVITADAAGNLATSSAELRGTLVTNGASAALVFVYWGTANQGQQAAGWQYTNDFGSFSAGASLATNTADMPVILTPGTEYHYYFYAVNGTTNAWSGHQSFTTYIEPAVNNTAGATDFTATSALLRGQVTQGIPQPAVFFALKQSATDPGSTDTSDWDRVIAAGSSSGDFSATASGLNDDANYWYRAFATNAAGEVWAPAASEFQTPEDVLLNDDRRRQAGRRYACRSLLDRHGHNRRPVPVHLRHDQGPEHGRAQGLREQREQPQRRAEHERRADHRQPDRGGLRSQEHGQQ